MAKAKQNSAYIKPNDGRKNNGRKKGDNYGNKKTLIKSSSQLTPAKKERISIYALNAMKNVFGSEEEAWKALAEQAKDSFAHMNLLWQYRYGKPQDGSDNNINKKLDVPVINFYASPNQVQNLQDTIDIESEEIDMDELNDE
tara:strand:- start:4906 stop:5331 length:426 start_codon:yes stop_codon:yes gene_type:complete